MTTAALLAAALFFQSAPWLDPDRTEPSGLRYATFQSRIAGSEVSYLVYVPPLPDAAGDVRYPVIYWLHGLNGSQRSGAAFVRQLNLAIKNGRSPAMIAVLVNGLRDQFYCDSKDGRVRLESVIIEELVPHIDATYRTVARREARFVEGYSMGGYGAAHLAFKYPDTFGAVGVMAGALLDAEALASRHAGIMTGVFGGDNAYFEENHPLTLLEKNAASIRGRVRIRVAVGDRDPLEPSSQALHELLRKLDIEHEYEVVPGVAHDLRGFYEALGTRGFGVYRASLSTLSRGPMTARVTPGKSNILTRGDLEILTFETEEDFRRLEALVGAKAEPGKLTTLYFRSTMDGSLQPYALWLPRDYKPAARYPLVVQLHGLNFKKVLGGGERARFRGMPRWVHQDLPVIVAQCFGRQSTFYNGMGEEDILETIADVSRRFSVDPERVYIMGHSMGGAGSYFVGLHYPDRFGGIVPIDAAIGRNIPISAGIPQWMEPQAALFTPEKLYPNARNLDVFWKHAGAGIQGDSTLYTDGIVSEGGFSTTEPFPGLGHEFSSRYSYANFIPQAIGHRIRSSPPEVRFFTTNLRYNQAYWVTLDQLEKHNADARVTATRGVDGVKVTTANIAALTLRLTGAAGNEVTIDGDSALSGELPETAHFAKKGGRWERAASPVLAAKRHSMQGPIGDALRSKFLAVYGEGDRDLAIAELDGIRNPPGPLTIAGDFPMKAAARVTSQDVRSSNLLLFGTPASNAVLKRIAPKLPVQLLGAESIFIHPNPENPSHYVVVWNAKLFSADNGIRPLRVMPIDLLPDWVIVKHGKVTSGGHFDNHWQYKAEPVMLTLEGDLERVHDPVVIKEGDRYYLFATGGRPGAGIIPIRCSKDLKRWTACGSVFEKLPEWVAKEVPKARGAWAPDISYFNGKFHLYYSVSSFGSRNSAIGLATANTLGAGSQWVDEGMVLRSYEEKDDWNAIDANLVTESNERKWLAWGSFWGGLKMKRIDPATGKLSTEDTNMYSLASRPRTPDIRGSIEAPFIVRHDGWWYLFASFDFCCRGAKSTYNIVVGRSKNVTGPYTDRSGRPMTEGGGTPVLAATTDNWRGPGHNAVLQDRTGDYLVFHAYHGHTGRSFLHISTLVWEDGWPRAATLP